MFSIKWSLDAKRLGRCGVEEGGCGSGDREEEEIHVH